MDPELVRGERLRLVQRLRPLEAREWALPSLCAGWTVRHVLAHLVTPFLVGRAEMAWTVLRARGVPAAMDVTAARLAGRPVAELLDVLEANAGSAFRPPGLPAEAPLTDVVVHTADIRWPLGDGPADWGDPERLRPVLDFTVSRRAQQRLPAERRLGAVRLVADDLDWSWGSGAEVRGGALVLALGMLGRSAALPHLSGDGVARLRS